MYLYLYYGSFRHRIVHFKFYRHTATSDFYRLVFTVIFILMNGLFTPIESVPKWAQILTAFNRIKYFVEVMRMVMLKGSESVDFLSQLIITMLYILNMNDLAVWSSKKAT